MLCGDAVSLRPASGGIYGNASQCCRVGSPDAFYDVRMSCHNPPIRKMRFDVKRQMRFEINYVIGMDTPADRLRAAREHAGFATAKEAAESMGVPVTTYAGHENGSRGIPAKRAVQYARKFKTTEEWILYGKGHNNGSAEVLDLWANTPLDRREEVIQILRLIARDKSTE